MDEELGPALTAPRGVRSYGHVLGILAKQEPSFLSRTALLTSKRREEAVKPGLAALSCDARYEGSLHLFRFKLISCFPVLQQSTALNSVAGLACYQAIDSSTLEVG